LVDDEKHATILPPTRHDTSHTHTLAVVLFTRRDADALKRSVFEQLVLRTVAINHQYRACRRGHQYLRAKRVHPTARNVTLMRTSTVLDDE
jgi:hypothetical protein